MRQPGEPERACGQQLVVRRGERARRIEHHDPAGREPLELELPALDSVEPLAHVEPAERDVARLEDAQRLARREHAGCDAE